MFTVESVRMDVVLPNETMLPTSAVSGSSSVVMRDDPPSDWLIIVLVVMWRVAGFDSLSDNLRYNRLKKIVGDYQF